MNVTIDITPSDALRTLLQRARNFPAETLQAMGRGLAASGHQIVGNALQYRFTKDKGPFPYSMHKLGHVTGRLRQSITNTPPQIQEGANTVTMGFGSNVKYFGIHEFGFSGDVTVRAHQRKGNPVRAHSRKVLIQARAPMTTELRDARTESIIMENVRRSVARMLKTMEGGPA